MMTRLQILAIVVFVALPTASRAQTIKELLDTNSKPRHNTATTTMDMYDLDAYSKAGWRAINKGYYDTAEHEFLSAIKTAKRPGLNDTRLIARCYADYAWALQKQGRNAEAEPLLKWALLAREASLEPTSPRIVQNLNQLATLYLDLGRYSEAEPLLHRAIETQSKSTKPNPLELARSQTLMGLQLAAQRRYAESEPYLEEALSIGEKAQGKSHLDTADAVSNLAWTYHYQGKDDEAQPLLERALAIIERSKGKSDYSAAHILDGLGQILSKKGKADEAEAYFLRAIAIWERFPNEGLSLLEVLRHYGNFLEEKGRLEDYGKIKARIMPLRTKYIQARAPLGPWYRVPEATQGLATSAPPRIPG
jgi:tetratricopeptide (TPR) repeat protein